ncbi:MAG: rod shape-determining protein MreC [Bilophila sp.]
MSPKRLLLLPALALLLYLGIYSWNQRTHILDTAVSNTGLEASGLVLKTWHFAQDTVMGTWNRYLDLVNVREENDDLKKQLMEARLNLILAAEERAELARLRHLLTLSPPEGWQSLGARVLAGRMGSNAALASVIIGRGYLSGAVPGTPVMTPDGIAGRVLRAGPSTATVLLLVDPGSRVAVVSQENRVQGILMGAGPFKPLELRFVSHNTAVRTGEILVTSGLDEAYPKGIPVARVISATPSDLSPFQSVQAVPLAELTNLEELLLVARQGDGTGMSGLPAGMSAPDMLSVPVEPPLSGAMYAPPPAPPAPPAVTPQVAPAPVVPTPAPPRSTRRNEQRQAAYPTQVPPQGANPTNSANSANPANSVQNPPLSQGRVVLPRPQIPGQAVPSQGQIVEPQSPRGGSQGRAVQRQGSPEQALPQGRIVLPRTPSEMSGAQGEQGQIVRGRP